MDSTEQSRRGVEVGGVVGKVTTEKFESMDSTEQLRRGANEFDTGAEFIDLPTPAAAFATPLTGSVTILRSRGSRSTQSGMTFPVSRLHSALENVQQFLASRL